MSDQSTRAPAPNPDPRQQFTLSLEDAQGLYGASIDPAKDANDLNAWWLEAGQRLGFVWTTVQGLELHGDGENITSATFTAWPEVAEWQPDPDAEAWLASMVTVGDPTTLKNRELILQAFAAGNDHGFAMGVATVPDAGLGWDGMELLRESAELFREYEAHHAAKVDAGRSDHGHAPAGAVEKEARNRVMAEKLETFLGDPSQSHLVHDGLREARGDAALGVVVGWEAALIEVRNLVESGRATMGSAIPPLVLLSHLEKLEAPEDMDEMLGPWRGVTEGIARIADMRGEKPAWAMTITGGGWSRADHLRWAGDAVRAWREFYDKSEWVREAIKLGVPKSLGMPSQLGRHTMDTARDLVARLNTLLAEAMAGTLAGLRVQAAADVLHAAGIVGKRCTCPDGGGIEADCPTHDAPDLAPQTPDDAARVIGTMEAAADAGLFKAQGINSAEELRQRARDPGAAGLAMSVEGQRPPQAVPGVYSADQGNTRYPIAEGLECMGKPEGEA